MKTSTILKRAERYLWDGIEDEGDLSTTLCYALQLASDGQGRLPKKACRRAQATIMRALDGRFTYSKWAVDRGYLPSGWLNKPHKWHHILQANRLNWLRELQRQFKAKGGLK